MIYHSIIQIIHPIASKGWAETFPSWVQAIGSMVLIGITWISIRNASRTVQEMQRDREFQFLPVVKIYNFRTWKAGDGKPNNVIIEFRAYNIGRDIAKDTELVLKGAKLRDAHFHMNMTLAPDDEYSEHYNFEAIDLTIFKDLPEEDRRITIKYKDIFDNEISTTSLLYLGKGEYQRGGGEEDMIFMTSWTLNLPK